MWRLQDSFKCIFDARKNILSIKIQEKKLKPINAKKTKFKIRELLKSIESLEGKPTRVVDI